MAVIYVITNEKNGKQYVGATKQTLEKRWKQHCSDMKRSRCSGRKLYSDMAMFGTENFTVKEIETVNDADRFGREQYWVKELKTYKNGYNETLGGDGKYFVDEGFDKLILKTYREKGTIYETAKSVGLDQWTVKRSLKRSGAEIKTSKEIMVERHAIPVDMLSLEGELERSFDSLASAEKFIRDSGLAKGGSYGESRHIKDVCNGKRKTAARHKWRFASR